MSMISSIGYGLIGCIESTLDRAAKGLIDDNKTGNKEWTHDCLSAIAQLGFDIGYGACPDASNMKGEWLYDLIWYMEEESEWPKRMTDVVLVLESEWSSNLCDIRYDFQKLVQAKSRLKMLISRDLSNTGLDELKRDIESFIGKDESEIYIFAMYEGCRDNPFRYETYRCGCNSQETRATK